MGCQWELQHSSHRDRHRHQRHDREPDGAELPHGVPRRCDSTLTSNLNWTASSPPTPNGVTVALSAAGAIKVFNKNGSIDVILDIVGYFVPGGSGPQGPPDHKGCRVCRELPARKVPPASRENPVSKAYQVRRGNQASTENQASRVNQGPACHRNGSTVLSPRFCHSRLRRTR